MLFTSSQLNPWLVRWGVVRVLHLPAPALIKSLPLPPPQPFLLTARTQNEEEEYSLLPWPGLTWVGVLRLVPVLSLHTESKFHCPALHAHYDWMLPFHPANFSLIPALSLPQDLEGPSESFLIPLLQTQAPVQPSTSSNPSFPPLNSYGIYC